MLLRLLDHLAEQDSIPPSAAAVAERLVARDDPVLLAAFKQYLADGACAARLLACFSLVRTLADLSATSPSVTGILLMWSSCAETAQRPRQFADAQSAWREFWDTFARAVYAESGLVLVLFLDLLAVITPWLSC